MFKCSNNAWIPREKSTVICIKLMQPLHYTGRICSRNIPSDSLAVSSEIKKKAVSSEQLTPSAVVPFSPYIWITHAHFLPVSVCLHFTLNHASIKMFSATNHLFIKSGVTLRCLFQGALTLNITFDGPCLLFAEAYASSRAT